MECFLPSEIARIVLGYLKEEGCNKAYKDFLVESVHLQEYTTFLHRGLEYPTKIGGKGLIDMLEDYGRIKLYELHKQPEMIHTLWFQLEQAMSQLKYVLSESLSPEFRTKGSILNSVMKSYVNQKTAYTRSMLALKKQKHTRGNTSGKCSSEKSASVGVSDNQQASTSTVSRTDATGWTSPGPATLDDRCKNPAFTSGSPVKKWCTSRTSSRSVSPELPSIARRRRSDSASRLKLPCRKKSDSISSGTESVTKLSNIMCLQQQREALIQGMRTGIVMDARQKRNGGRPLSEPAGRDDVNMSGSSAAGGRSRKTVIENKKSSDVMSDGVDDDCEHVTMETDIEVDSNDDVPCSHDLELDHQTASSEGNFCTQSSLKTPVKKLMVEETSRDAFRSPRRKSQAPKRLTISGPAGNEREVTGETVVPPVSVILPVDLHNNDSCDNLLSMPVLDELINSRLFAERLAENINKVKLSVETTHPDKPHSSAAQPSTGTTTSTSTATLAPLDVKIPTKTSLEENSMKVDEKAKTGDVLTARSSETVSPQQTGDGSPEEDPSMSDAAVSGIIALTQNDPDFDAIFSNLFGIDFSGTDIMGEMSCSAALSTNQNAADATMQNEAITRHDFTSGSVGHNVESVEGKCDKCPSTQSTNIAFVNVETTTGAPKSQNADFVPHNADASGTFSTFMQTAMEQGSVLQNPDEMKAPEPSLVPGTFVQIYHTNEDGSTGYYETVQVVSSDEASDKTNTPPSSGDRHSDGRGLGQSDRWSGIQDDGRDDRWSDGQNDGQGDRQGGKQGDRQGDGQGDRQRDGQGDSQGDKQGDNRAMENCLINVAIQDVAIASKDSTSLTTINPCSSAQHVPDTQSTVATVVPSVELSAQDQQAVLIMPSGETYVLPAGTNIISQLSNGGKLQPTLTSQSTAAPTCVTHDVVAVETETMSQHIENGQILASAGENRHGENPTCDRTATSGVGNVATAQIRTDVIQAVDSEPHTMPTNKQNNAAFPPAVTDEADTDYSFTTIDSQALEALRNYDSASPSPAKVTPKAQKRKTAATRNKGGVQNHTVRTLGNKPQTSVNQSARKLGQILGFNTPQQINRQTCAASNRSVIKGDGRMTCTGTSTAVATSPVVVSCVKKMTPFQSTVLSREMWQAKIHDGHWTLVNERKEKRKYLGVPTKRSSQTPESVATVIPAVMTTMAQWRCLSQSSGVSSKLSCQQIGGGSAGTLSAASGATVGSSRHSVGSTSHTHGFHIENGVPTVGFSQSAEGEKRKMSLSFGEAIPHGRTVSDISQSPLDMTGVYETMSKVASNTAAIKVTCEVTKDRSWTADIDTVLDLISPKTKGVVRNHVIDNDVTQVAWSVSSHGANSHVRTLNFDVNMPRSCMPNTESGSGNAATSRRTTACVTQQTLSLHHRHAIQMLSIGTAPNLAVDISKSGDHVTSTSTAVDVLHQSKPIQGTQNFTNVASKECILNTGVPTGVPNQNSDPQTVNKTRQMSVSANAKDGATKTRDSSRRPARRVAMKTIKRADEMLAERSQARNATLVLPSAHTCDENNERWTDKRASGNVLEINAADKDVMPADNSAAPYKSVSPIPSACISRVNGYTTVCESEVAEALVAFATSVVITPVKNTPNVCSTHSSNSASCDTDKYVNSITAPKCSTPLGQPPPLSSVTSPVSVQCNSLSLAVSPVLVQCKPKSVTASPASVQCKSVCSTMSLLSAQCNPTSMTMSPVLGECKPKLLIASPVSVQCKPMSSMHCKSLSSTASPVLTQCKMNATKTHSAQETLSANSVGGSITLPLPGDTRKQGKRTLNIEGQHLVKPKRIRLKKRQRSLANMDVDKFLSKLHPK